MSYQPVETEFAKDLIGEGLHTGLRKGCEDGHAAWTAISRLDPDDWNAALSFLVDGLDAMGFVLCERQA